jgi:hypothetical protein
MKICAETPNRIKIGQFVWQLQYILLLPAVLNLLTSTVFRWNGIKLLGWPRRYKHYVNMTQCCVIHTLPVLFCTYSCSRMWSDIHWSHQRIHIWYLWIHSYIAPSCFGIIYAIFRELYTKIYKWLEYNRLQSNSYYMTTFMQLVPAILTLTAWLHVLSSIICHSGEYWHYSVLRYNEV